MWIRGLCTHSTTPIRQPWQRVAVRNRKQCIILYKWRDRNTSAFIKSEVLSAIVEIGSWNYGNMRGRGVRQDWRRSNSIAFLTSEYKLARWWGKGKGDREKGKLIGMGNNNSVSIADLWGLSLGEVRFGVEDDGLVSSGKVRSGLCGKGLGFQPLEYVKPLQGINCKPGQICLQESIQFYYSAACSFQENMN